MPTKKKKTVRNLYALAAKKRKASYHNSGRVDRGPQIEDWALDSVKQKKLEASGWHVGDAEDFLQPDQGDDIGRAL